MNENTNTAKNSQNVQNPQSRKAEKSAPKPASKGWIRWSGIAGLGILGISGFALSYFEAQNWVKQQLEQQASEAWGAKVEVGKVDFTLSPLGFQLQHLALTDPDKPMENLLVLNRLQGDISLYHLVAGRTVINHAVAEGLALHQPRKTSGALPKKMVASHAASKSTASSLPKIDPLKSLQKAVPSPDELLKKERLVTQARAEKVQQDIEQLQQTWKEVQQSIPTEAKLKQYQQQFQQLTRDLPKDIVAIQKRQLEFELLKKQVELDKRRLAEGQQQLRQQLAQLKQDIALLKQAPAEDFQRLQAKYSLDGKGLSNLTALLFGPQVQGWLQTAQVAYEKAKPVIEYFQSSEEEKAAAEEKRRRNLGREVRFTEYDPEPSFIVHKGLLSAQLGDGKWMAQLKDVNFEQSTYGKPTTFRSLYQPPTQPTPLVVAGMVNHVFPKQPLDKASAEWKQYQVKDWALLKDNRMTVKLAEATAQFEGEGRLLLNPKTQKLDQLLSNFTIQYRKAKFDLSQSKAKEVHDYLAPGFVQVHQFDVKGKIKGDLWAPKAEISSDLDRHLSKAFNRVLQKRMQAAKVQLKAELTKRAQAQLQPVEQQLQAYLGKEVKLNGDIAQLQKILQSKFNQRLEQEKQRLINEAKRKVQAEVDKRKAQLEAEKRKLQQQAEAEKKRQEEKVKQRLEQKLKGLFR